MNFFTISQLTKKNLFSAKVFSIFGLAIILFFGNSETVKAQQIGIFGSFAILNTNGGGNVFYDLQSVTANPDFQNANLGTFLNTNSLVLAGAENKTFKNSGGNVTGGNLYFRVFLTSGAPGSFSSGINLPFVSNDGGGGDQTWRVSNNTTNVLTSLAPGNYTLEVFTDAPGFPSTAFSNNGGANYKATFTIVAIPLAPVSTAPTALNVYGFTANWNASVGATSYRLDVNQMAEDFTDGNFTASPVWSGSTGSYAIQTATPLVPVGAVTDLSYIGSNASVGNSGLNTPSTESSEWLFSLGSTNFTPSSDNNFGVILMSTAAVTNITAGTGTSFNGYFLRIGVDAVIDRLELWRSDATARTKVGDFTGMDFQNGAAQNGVNLRISRSSTGVFSVFYSTGFRFSAIPTLSGGTLTDATHSSSSFFGLFTSFANPGPTRRVYLDNITFGSSNFVSGFNNLTVAGLTQAVTLPSFGTYFYKVRANNTSGTSPNSNPQMLDFANDATVAFRSRQTGDYNSASTWEYNQAGDGVFVNALNAPSATNPITIQTAHVVTLTANATVNTGGSLTVSTGGTLNASTFVISGTGVFTVNAGATFITANSGGLNASVTTTTSTYTNGSNYVFNGSVNQATGTKLPASIATLQINTTSGGIVSLSNTALTISATSNSLQLTSGTLRIGIANTVTFLSGANIVATGGNLATTGTNGEDGGNIIFQSSGSATGTITFNNVVLNSAAVNFGTASTVNGNLQINAGAFVNVNAVTYSSNSTLIYNALNVTYNRGIEWQSLTGAGYPNNVLVQNGCTVNLNSGSSTNRAIAGNLILGTAASAGSLTMQALPNSLTVNGNVVVGAASGPATSSLLLSTAIGGDLFVRGNFTRNTNGVLTTNNRLVSFFGPVNSSITSPTTQDFTFFDVNKISNTTLTLNANIQVLNSLTLTSGSVITGANRVIIPSGSAVSRTSGFVFGNLQKRFAIGSNVVNTFENGDGTNYTPISVTFASVTTAGDIVVNSKLGQQANIASSILSTIQNLTIHYSITNGITPVVFNNYSTTLNFQNPANLLNSATPLTFSAGLFNTSWIYPTIGTRTTTATTLNNLTTFGDFVLVSDANMTQWNGTTFTNGSPNATSKVVLNGDYTVGVNDGGVNLNVASLVVSSPNTLTVNADKTVTLSGPLQNNGIMTLKSSSTRTASFIDNGTISGSGVYNVEQHLTGTGGASPTGRVWFVGSPLTTALSAALNPALTQRLVFWNESTQSFTSILNNVTPLIPMVGYQTRVGSTGAFTFTGGQFNTGIISNTNLTRTGISAPQRGFHLVSNPYPSHLNWNLTTRVNLQPTIWYRTATAGNVNVFDTYNIASGIGTNNRGTGAVTGFIPPMQSVWIQVKGDGNTGSLTFNNSLRSHVAGSINRTATTQEILRMTLSNTIISDETIIHLNTAANSALDDYDSPKLFASDPTIPQLYTAVGATSLTINGFNNLTQGQQIDLGLKIGVAGSYELNATELNFGPQLVTLHDKLLNVFQNLNANPLYVFTAAIGNSSNRFTLIFDQPLPVSLLSFSGNKLKEAIKFTWKAAIEINTDSYEIQILQDKEFVTIGKISAKNKENSVYGFDYVSAISGINYFRLKILNLNGDAQLSKVINVDNGTIKSAFSVYPTITSDQIEISFSEINSNASIKLYDQLGKLIITKNQNPNSSKDVLDLSNLPNGTYTLTYQDHSSIESKLIIKK